MTPDVIEKKWRCHDDLAVTVNDAAPCCSHSILGSITIASAGPVLALINGLQILPQNWK